MMRLLDSTQVGSGHKDSSITSISPHVRIMPFDSGHPQIFTIRCLLSVFSTFLVSLRAEKPIRGICPFVSCVPGTSPCHAYARHENPCFRHLRLPTHHVMERPKLPCSRHLRFPQPRTACRLAAQGLSALCRAMLHSVTNRTYNTNGIVRRPPRQRDQFGR